VNNVENSKESDDIQSEEKISEPTPSNIEKDITIKKSTYNKMIKGLVVAIAIATFFGGYSLGTMQDSGLSSEELESVIIGAAQRTAALSPQPTQQPTQSAGPQIIQVSLDDDPVKGDPDAPITIVEFSDFQCPFCKRFHETTLPLIQENYIDTGKVKFVYRDFPLESIHPNGAIPAAVASECADEQGMFWQYHDKIFQNQKNWERLAAEDVAKELKAYAQELGLNTNQFNDCLNSGKYMDEVNKDFQDAVSYGLTGTPAFFIGNEKDGYIKVTGAQPYSVFQNVLDQMLAN